MLYYVILFLLYFIGVRGGSRTGYSIPGCDGMGAWTARNSSAAAAVAAVVRRRRRAAACGAAVRGYFIFHIPLTPISFAKLLNEFRSYFLLALLNYLMNLFLGGAISY